MARFDDHSDRLCATYLTFNNKKYVKKKERGRHLPGYSPWTSLECTDDDEKKITKWSFQSALWLSSAEEEEQSSSSADESSNLLSFFVICALQRCLQIAAR